MNKMKIEKDKIDQEDNISHKLANKNKDKVISERRQRTTDEFLNDQALWEHKKMTQL
jgi:hypothetical protein